MKLEIFINVLCAALPFLIVSSRRVPGLKQFPIFAILMRGSVFFMALTFCALLFGTSFWLTGTEIPPRAIIASGLIFAPACFTGALLYSSHHNRLTAGEDSASRVEKAEEDEGNMRQWPLVLTSLILLVCLLPILVAGIYFLLSGGLPGVETAGIQANWPRTLILGILIFGTPIYISVEFLLRRKRRNAVLFILSGLLTAPLYLYAMSLLVSSGLKVGGVHGIVFFGGYVVIASYVDQVLKAYCNGKLDVS